MARQFEAIAGPDPARSAHLASCPRSSHGNAAYLARVCHDVCAQRYWTSARFAPEVIEAGTSALDALKSHFGAQRLVLVGYSGGGVVAALLAERRNDIARLVTIASNLDHAAWTALHGVSPLQDSLNPVTDSYRLRGLAQTHFVSERDRNVPPVLARSYGADFIGTAAENLTVIKGYDHHCCWLRHWRALANFD